MQGKIQGAIKLWNAQRGFGFVQIGDYPEVQDFFCHISSCMNNYTPEMGDCVLFKLTKDSKKGNLVASQVQPTGQSFKSQYFSYQHRNKIRRDLRAAKREEEYDYKQRWKENYMQSEKFNRDYCYEKKEGYQCRNCRRELNQSTFQCNCQSYDQ